MGWRWSDTSRFPTNAERLDQLFYLLLSIYRSIRTLKTQQENQAMALADLEAAIGRQSTVADRVVALLETLSADLKAAVAAQDPEAIQALINMVDSNTQRLADAAAAAGAQPAA